MKTSEVIDYILTHEGLNSKQFAESVGIKPTQVYDLKTGKVKRITDKMAAIILEKYSKYSKSWLLTGDGPVFTSDSNKETDPGNVEFGSRDFLLKTIHNLSETVNRQSKEVEYWKNKFDELLEISSEKLTKLKDENSTLKNEILLRKKK